MRNSLQSNKKGVSEIVSYSLLIVIAIIAGILVYGMLKLYAPKEKTECPDGTSLVIKSYTCDINIDPILGTLNQLNITLVNKGKFTVDAAYIRIGLLGQQTKTWINSDTKGNYANFYFYNQDNSARLKPGSEFSRSLDAGTVVKSAGTYILEVQPAIGDKDTGKVAACTSATIEQAITCS